MTTAQISMLSPEEATANAIEAGMPVYMAELSIFRIALRRPRIAKSLNDHLHALLRRGELQPRLRELVIMRIGWRTGSVYEWGQHWAVASRLGVSPSDLIAVRDWPRHNLFSAQERAALEATDDYLQRGFVPPSTWEMLRGHFGEGLLFELLVVISTWTMMSSVLRSLEVPLEDGATPWPPDGQVSPHHSRDHDD
jgi:alkylhydroperoxidase family enzyme